MPAPKEHIKAGTDAASGTIDVDLMNLANTRGEIKADLLSLTTKTFDDAKNNASQTTHARTWLEVADGEEGKIADDVKATNRWAVYAIRSVDNLSATDLTKVPATKDGDDEVRTVTATTHGEFSFTATRSIATPTWKCSSATRQAARRRSRKASRSNRRNRSARRSPITMSNRVMGSESSRRARSISWVRRWRMSPTSASIYELRPSRDTFLGTLFQNRKE